MAKIDQKSPIMGSHQIHFTTTNNDNFNHKILQDVGYHNANNTTTDNNSVITTSTTASNYNGISNIPALIEAISLQANNKQANFTKILEILLAIFLRLQKPSPFKPTITKLILLKYLKFWKSTVKYL